MSQIIVHPGNYVSVQFHWKNVGGAAFAPDFRTAIRSSDPMSTWIEGSWIAAVGVAPGETHIAAAGDQKIPGDWGAGVTIDIQLRARVVGSFGETVIQEWLDVFLIPKVEADWIEIIEPELFVKE